MLHSIFFNIHCVDIHSDVIESLFGKFLPSAKLGVHWQNFETAWNMAYCWGKRAGTIMNCKETTLIYLFILFLKLHEKHTELSRQPKMLLSCLTFHNAYIEWSIFLNNCAV